MPVPVKAHRGARVLAPQRVARGGARQHVVVRRDGAEIGARRRGGAVPVLVVADGHARRADVEEVAAQRAREVHAFAMLRVHLRGDGERDAAELIARRIQHLAAPVEQAAERAAGDTARDVDRAAPVSAARAACVPDRADPLRGDLSTPGAEHQRLAIADEDVERAIAFGDHGDAHLGGQLVDELVALIEQIVGRLAGSAGWPRRCRR